MSDPQNKVPFFLAGDGAYLRFRTADLVALRNHFGAPKPVKVRNRLGIEEDAIETFMDRLQQEVAINDPIAIVKCLEAGLKQPDGRKPFTGISYDDLPFGLAEARRPILDALVLGVTGEDYAALLARRKVEEEIAARNERLKQKGAIWDDPQDPQETLTEAMSSTEPSGSDTPPAS